MTSNQMNKLVYHLEIKIISSINWFILYVIMIGERQFKNQNAIIHKVAYIKYRSLLNPSIPKCYWKLIEVCWWNNLKMGSSFDEIAAIIIIIIIISNECIDFDEVIFKAESNVEILDNYPFLQILKVVPKIVSLDYLFFFFQIY